MAYRRVVLAVLAGVLVGLGVLTGPAVAAEPAPGSEIVLAQTQPGPVLDPAETERANGENSRSKLIAGGAAVVLAGIVFWGRRVRKKRRSGG
ncbi:hypothetical protein [Amycolatopsis suaedae]|uniref:hypothetical protein n=1 Tax=Amycolatopsis suaedae TaxID=2510978 RepID=UPI001F0D9863|nr:hypothetical protein [Amycolatopsis suaedae]